MYLKSIGFCLSLCTLCPKKLNLIQSNSIFIYLFQFCKHFSDVLLCILYVDMENYIETKHFKLNLIKYFGVQKEKLCPFFAPFCTCLFKIFITHIHTRVRVCHTKKIMNAKIVSLYWRILSIFLQ